MTSLPSPRTLQMVFAFSAVVGTAGTLGYAYLEAKTSDMAQNCETQIAQEKPCTAKEAKAYAANKAADTGLPLSVGLLGTGLIGLGITRSRKP